MMEGVDASSMQNLQRSAYPSKSTRVPRHRHIRLATRPIFKKGPASKERWPVLFFQKSLLIRLP
jgi:hypothetical protein